jgi:hypothetical protein
VKVMRRAIRRRKARVPSLPEASRQGKGPCGPGIAVGTTSS